MKESTAMGNLGKLPPELLGIYRQPSGYENEGEACTTPDGRQGKLVRAKTGGLICQAEGTDMSASNVTEATVALRFSSPSRTQIGKAYTQYAIHMNAVQGTGNLTISDIQGTPGAWYFTVSSPTANQTLDPTRIPKIDGVTIAQVAAPAPQAASAPQPKSVRERVQEQVNAILSKAK